MTKEIEKCSTDDPDRAVYYVAWDPSRNVALAGSLVEIFGDIGIVTPGEYRVAVTTTTRTLNLLDPRGSGAMPAGTVSAIAKCEYALSQPWACYFYEETTVYGMLDGLLYANAHNDGPAVMLYERARDALICDEHDTIRLDSAKLRPVINRIMIEHSLTY